MPRSPAFWLAALLFLALVALKLDRASGFTSLLHFGEPWAARRIPPAQSLPVAVAPQTTGYDGQFYAQIALDPLLRNPALDTSLDAPAYRARRILVPATAHLLGLGRPWLILNIYALLNSLCWFAVALLLWREIDDSSAIGFARWFACLFSLGVLDSVRQSLVDLPALLLLVIAIHLHRVRRPVATGFTLALGHLTRETSLLASFALLSWPLRFDWRRLALLALTASPMLVWVAYVAARFPVPQSNGIGNFTWPFLGIVGQLQISMRELLAGNFDSRHVFAVLGIASLAVQIVALWRLHDPHNAWWRVGVVYSVLLLFLGAWVWSGYWAAFRAVLPLTIAFNLLLPAGRRFWPLWIFGNLTVLHAVWRFL